MLSIKRKYKSFLSSKEGTGLYNDFKNILYGHPDSLIEYFKHHFLTDKFVPHSKKLNICDVGGGDGKRIIQILEFLHEKYNKQFHLDFIEQSSVFCKAFETNLHKITPYSTVNIQNCLFEEANFTRKYDFIFLIHSIFSLQDSSNILKLLQLLNSNGKIILFSNAADSFLGILKKELDKEYPDKRFEINHVKESLNRLSINYRSYQFYTEWSIPQKEVYPKILTILQWLSLDRFSSFPESRKQEIFDLILNMATFQNGRYYFKEKEEVVIIYGNREN